MRNLSVRYRAFQAKETLFALFLNGVEFAKLQYVERKGINAYVPRAKMRFRRHASKQTWRGRNDT
jgi:hypothetical protein